MSRFIVRAVRPDGRVSWLAKPTSHLVRHLGPRESAAVFDLRKEAQEEADVASTGYAILGIELAVEAAD